jgi:hypothetical protein
VGCPACSPPGSRIGSAGSWVKQVYLNETWLPQWDVAVMRAAASCVKQRWRQRAASLSDACGMCMQAGTRAGATPG